MDLQSNNWCGEHDITIADLNFINEDQILDWTLLKNKNILITGGSGSIGSCIVKTLLFISDKQGLNIKLYANGRNFEKLSQVFKKQRRYFNKNLYFLVYDVNQELQFDTKFDFIVHCANITDSQSMIDKPVETINTSYNGTRNVLEYAKQNKIDSLVYLSSIEVYGKTNNIEIDEDDFGLLNFLNLRSSYTESKRLTELLCKSYFSEYKVPVRIARLTQTFGTKISNNDRRMYSQFAESIRDNKPIILHTEGKTKKEYIYTFDAVHCILTLLIKGKDGEVYNVSNPENYLSVLDIANFLTYEYKLPRIVLDINSSNSIKYSQTIDIKLKKLIVLK